MHRTIVPHVRCQDVVVHNGCLQRDKLPKKSRYAGMVLALGSLSRWQDHQGRRETSRYPSQRGQEREEADEEA